MRRLEDPLRCRVCRAGSGVERVRSTLTLDKRKRRCLGGFALSALGLIVEY